MILTGILRHYLTTLLQTAPKKQPLAKIREQRWIVRGQNLKNNFAHVSKAAFERRKEYFIDGAREGKFLADPENRGKPKGNPMSDPAAMEGMMGMMKGQVAMMVPQSLIMGWINAFFSGYVISESDALSYPDTDPWLIAVDSETSFPAHTTVQANATGRCGNSRSGCAMGVQPELVLSDVVRSATSLQFHPWKQQW
jgi:hypothetical protein